MSMTSLSTTYITKYMHTATKAMLHQRVQCQYSDGGRIVSCVFALQVDEAMKMNTTDNVSVITICLTAAAPPKRTFSGHVSVQRTLSHEGLNRLGSAIMSADDSRTGV